MERIVLSYSITDQWESNWAPEQRERMRELKEETRRKMDVLHKEIGWVIIDKETGQVYEPTIVYQRRKECETTIEWSLPDGIYKPIKVKLTVELI